ncbi:glycosyltransferase, partial [bacterium]|nr:glycosyltransferase [bacterium]
MDVSVIIVSWNTAALTCQTVESVYASLVDDGEKLPEIEVIVVDNDSHDGTRERLAKLAYPNLHVYNTGENLGFGRGNNFGLDRAHGEFVWFLNSDTIVQPGALSKLWRYYRENYQKARLGLVAAQLENPDGTWQPQGGDTPSLLTIATTWFLLDDIPLVGKMLPAVQHTGRRFVPKLYERAVFVPLGWVG